MMPCCAFAPYRNEGVALDTGQALELTIQLQEGVSLNVLGDDPGTIADELRRRQVIPDLPVPRMASGTPDLSGLWLLVVDTIGFNSQGWNDVYPRTEMMRLEERYTRTDYGHLDVRLTITDPGVFTKPWVQHLRFDLAPQADHSLTYQLC